MRVHEQADFLIADDALAHESAVVLGKQDRQIHTGVVHDGHDLLHWNGRRLVQAELLLAELDAFGVLADRAEQYRVYVGVNNHQ